MELLYPRHFDGEVSIAATRWGVDEEILYGLVRTESAFIPDVVSHAGAVGLAQLMPATGLDVSNRIRRSVELRFIDKNPDLRDPLTNLHLGAWYYADLLRRTGRPMLALFSYNGGLSRVRRWAAEEKDLPEDLFLETISIRETREYGRKVLAAGAVYGYLYYGKTLEQVVSDLFPDQKTGGSL
jgi:soluble lytic murein transglycosylase